MNIPKSFTMKAPNGATLLMVRHGKDIKAVYAESPKTGMGQDDGAPRRQWEKTAERELAANVATEMQAALNGVALSPGVIPSDE